MDLSAIPFNQSPNCGTRGTNKITHIILHCPIGTLAGTVATFKNSNTKVSAHYVVDRDGSIVQMVRLTDAAWHAMHQPNLWSIGIEMVDRYSIDNNMSRGCMGDPHWYTNPELNSAADLVASLMQQFNIPLANVLGHNDPWLRQFGNNHQDPGPYWPWKDFRQMVSNDLQQILINLGHKALIDAGIPEPHYLSTDINKPPVQLPKWNPLAKKKK